MPILTKIDDPRDDYEKMTRDEIRAHAKRNGWTDIDADMPAALMMREMRKRGIRAPDMSGRVLGRPIDWHGNGEVRYSPADSGPSRSVDLEDHLAQEYARQKARPADVADMTIQQLRKEASRRGIKQTPKDNTQSLRAKLSGEQNAA